MGNSIDLFQEKGCSQAELHGSSIPATSYTATPSITEDLIKPSSKEQEPHSKRSRGSHSDQKQTAPEILEWTDYPWGKLSWSITARVYVAYVGKLRSPAFKNKPEVISWVENLPPWI